MCVNTCVARLPMWKQINTLNELTHVFEVVGMVGWGGLCLPVSHCSLFTTPPGHATCAWSKAFVSSGF